MKSIWHNFLGHCLYLRNSTCVNLLIDLQLTTTTGCPEKWLFRLKEYFLKVNLFFWDTLYINFLPVFIQPTVQIKWDWDDSLTVRNPRRIFVDTVRTRNSCLVFFTGKIFLFIRNEINVYQVVNSKRLRNEQVVRLMWFEDYWLIKVVIE